ncbi:MAG: DUF6629 family protein [Bacteroidales bacterium]
MCFSAGASFAGGIIITGIGVATYREVHKPSQLVFASIPVFFGVQQIVEGCLWLTLPYADYVNIQKTATYCFLIMAQVLWPVMIPVSVLLVEEDKKRKRIRRILLILGLSLSLYYSYCLVSFNVTPQITGRHIEYKTNFPDSFAMLAFIVYLIATITPLFVSGIKRTHLLGMLMFSSCLVTAIFFTQYLISVWCFFAALISGVIFWILRDSKKEFNFKKIALLKISSVISSYK